MRPVIGITTGRRQNEYGQATVALTEAYIAAVMEAGGVPLLVPVLSADGRIADLCPRLDGILFSGGGDIAPERFGGAPHPKIDGVDRPRDECELALLKKVISAGKPFLGICRGCQLVNVGLGGTLYTHLPDQLQGALQHDNPGDRRHDLVHEVAVETKSSVGRVLAEPFLPVNSHHHQGLRDLGTGLRPVGHSPDGLVEAIELADHPFGLAVQWHPEWLNDLEPTRRLFRRFVEAAAGDRT